MKKLIIALSVFALILGSCKTKQKGMTEVNEVFSGNKYEGNNRFFRATGSGESSDLETAKDKALLLSKQRLASSVQTQIKQVAENYKGDVQDASNIGDFKQRFQQLTREVLNQIIVEINVIDQKTFRRDGNGNYVSHVALEAKKKAVYLKLKEIASARTGLSQKDKDAVQQMIDETIKSVE